MTVYIFTGHLGAGKTLTAVSYIRDALLAGRQVASNMTLNMDAMLPPDSRKTYTKLPAIPRAEDLFALGKGYEGKYNEKEFGWVMLDEAGTWLNTRDWQDKDRRELFRWITHARKLHWHVALICQDFETIDKQIRQSISEIVVICSRLDRIGVPFLGAVLPKAHIASERYKTPTGARIKRKIFKGEDLYPCYNTEEAVVMDVFVDETGNMHDARGMSSGLSAWHLRGRYRVAPPPWWSALYLLLLSPLYLLLGPLLAGAAGRSPAAPAMTWARSAVNALTRADCYRVPRPWTEADFENRVPRKRQRAMLDASRQALSAGQLQEAKAWLERYRAASCTPIT